MSVKEKKIDVVNLLCSLDAESYNLSVEFQGLNDTFKITQEEYYLLKEGGITLGDDILVIDDITYRNVDEEWISSIEDINYIIPYIVSP